MSNEYIEDINNLFTMAGKLNLELERYIKEGKEDEIKVRDLAERIVDMEQKMIECGFEKTSEEPDTVDGMIEAIRTDAKNVNYWLSEKEYELCDEARWAENEKERNRDMVEIKDFPVYTCVGNLVSCLYTGKNMDIYSVTADSIDTNPEETARRVSEATNMPLSEVGYVEPDDWKNILAIKNNGDKWESDRYGNITLSVTVDVDMDLLKETIDKNKESDRDYDKEM